VQNVSTQMKVAVDVPAITAKGLAATVTEVGYSASGTGSYPVTVRLDADDKRLRPGMAAQVHFTSQEGATKPAKLAVPIPAVGQDASGAYVFVLEPAGDEVFVARKRRIVIGPITPAGFVLREGLRAGERVATAGPATLYDGMKVTLLEQAP
jgi:multidrug efflux system membrane fusion protein